MYLLISENLLTQSYSIIMWQDVRGNIHPQDFQRYLCITAFVAMEIISWVINISLCASCNPSIFPLTASFSVKMWFLQPQYISTFPICNSQIPGHTIVKRYYGMFSFMSSDRHLFSGCQKLSFSFQILWHPVLEAK